MESCRSAKRKISVAKQICRMSIVEIRHRISTRQTLISQQDVLILIYHGFLALNKG